MSAAHTLAAPPRSPAQSRWLPAAAGGGVADGVPTSATAATRPLLLASCCCRRSCRRRSFRHFRASALLEAAEGQPLEAPTSSAAASARAWPIARSASTRAVGQESVAWAHARGSQ
eukprot:4117447-Prymnesium_polylepis.1